MHVVYSSAAAVVHPGAQDAVGALQDGAEGHLYHYTIIITIIIIHYYYYYYNNYINLTAETNKRSRYAAGWCRRPPLSLYDCYHY